MPWTHTVACRGRAWGALSLYSAVYLSWMLLRWGPPGSRETIGDLFQTIFNAVVVYMCWRASRRCESAPRLRSAWRLITFGAALGLASNLAQLYYETLIGTVPKVSLIDLFSLGVYPPVITALMRFPVARASRIQRLQLVLDATILAIGGFVVMWFVELGPAVVAPSRQSLAQGAVSAVFTIGDLAVLAVVAGVLIRGTTPASRRALRLFGSGCLVFVGVHVLYGYITIRLHWTHHGGDWLDPVWYAGFVLWTLAARAQRRPDSAEVEWLDRGRRLRRRASWAPNVAVAIALGLLVYADRGDAFFPAFSLLIASVVLIVLVSARQLAAQRELLDVQDELKTAHDELAALATTDALTGLPNHRALVTALDHEFERADRTRRPFGLLFLDVDHFKALNDTLGHPAGDQALRELGQVLRGALRGVDTVGRWGGEEFIVLVPEIEAHGVVQAAERVRAAVAQHRFLAAGEAHLTCSIGVACGPEDAPDRDALLAAADQAMYVAKQLGRNLVISAHDHAAAALVANPADRDRADQALVGSVEALAAIVNARDRYTGKHSDEVAVLSQRVALELGRDAAEIHMIGLAARLHDIGKVAISDSILNKPGRLTPEEWHAIRQHPAIGADIAARIPQLRPASVLIRSHNERYDGSGYPDRLSGEDIPLGAKIICAVDAYNAMTTDRPHATRRTPAEAVDELRLRAGSQFDPVVIRALIQVLAGGDQPSEPRTDRAVAGSGWGFPR